MCNEILELKAVIESHVSVDDTEREKHLARAQRLRELEWNVCYNAVGLDRERKGMLQEQSELQNKLSGMAGLVSEMSDLTQSLMTDIKAEQRVLNVGGGRALSSRSWLDSGTQQHTLTRPMQSSKISGCAMVH